MKPRYNCAVPQQSSHALSNRNRNRSIANANSTDAVATDYKLVLWPSSDHLRKQTKNAGQSLPMHGKVDDDAVCDLATFIEDLGGPGGVASLILKQKSDASTTSSSSISSSSNNHNNKSKKMLTVVLHGSSYLRQVWESLACSRKDNITDLLLYYQDVYLPNNSNFADSSRIISFEKTEPKKKNYTHGKGCLYPWHVSHDGGVPCIFSPSRHERLVSSSITNIIATNNTRIFR
jgi:hypothetical protein